MDGQRVAGFDVETFATGEKTLERLAQVRPALMLLDLHLPGVTGPEILKHIRSDERLKDMLVIIASADHLVSESLRDQVTMVLLKPISFAQLSGLVARMREKLPS